jgi:putative ABC transport system substrate-binding protein
MQAERRDHHMRRRDFIAWVGSGALGWPLAVRAQPQAKPVIGYLSSKEERAEVGIVAGIRKGLAVEGFQEGRNVAFAYRWSSGVYDQLPRLAADLVASKVDVIAASGLPAAIAAKAATSTIPIVFRLAVDPVAFGLTQSFDRPGGHITGVTMLFDPLTAKKLELLHELVPSRAVGLLVNPKNPNHVSHQSYAEVAVKNLGLELTVMNASNGGEISAAFVRARDKGIRAVLVGDDPLFDVESAALIAAALRTKIPTMFYVRDFVSIGGLISYGPTFDEMAFQVGVNIGRILKGAKPADLPVQQPTKFELVINLKTARALGLAIPPTMIARADEVIE